MCSAWWPSGPRNSAPKTNAKTHESSTARAAQSSLPRALSPIGRASAAAWSNTAGDEAYVRRTPTSAPEGLRGTRQLISSRWQLDIVEAEWVVVKYETGNSTSASGFPVGS